MRLVKIFSFILFAIVAVEAGSGPVPDEPTGDDNPFVPPKRWISRFVVKRDEVPQA